jgi:predicted anti-sigma-YlaC factor YlaD
VPARIKVDVGSRKNRFASTCGEIAENLSAYLEQDLAFLRRRRVRRHLRGCLRCRHLLRSLGWTVERLRTLGTSEVASRSVAERVVERIRAEAADSSS